MAWALGYTNRMPTAKSHRDLGGLCGTCRSAHLASMNGSVGMSDGLRAGAACRFGALRGKRPS